MMLSLISAWTLLAGHCFADSAAFDLPGPRVEIRVTRSGKTLPISEVPNLKPGDRLWILPPAADGKSAHYLLVAAFLRGTTDPPPEQWFTKEETWDKHVKQEDVVVTVPANAEQSLLFLAPETGGDFTTLRSAVRGKPEAFVRASQDLNQAELDRSRLDKYLAGIREASDTDAKSLEERSLNLARSLKIKVDHQCFDKPTEQQAPCLMQNTDQLVLDDGHSQSMVAALTSGTASDLVGTISTGNIAGGGAYSPYVGAVIDLAHMMENFHTAQYQYIPALVVPGSDQLDLKLNNPPSFHKPMSVIVIALPAVEAVQPPPLRAVDVKEVGCLEKPGLVLPVDGAPLVFSTAYAHDLVLHVHDKTGGSADLPVTQDAARGGLVVDAKPLRAAKLGGNVAGSLRGEWGFDVFNGPTFALRNASPTKWVLPSKDGNGLIVGREDAFHLQSDEAPCVDQVTIKDAHGKQLKTTWRLVESDEVEVKVPLQDESAGSLMVMVSQSGLGKPDEIPVQAYSEAARLDRFVVNAGDREATLTGTRLDEVAGVQLGKVHFVPRQRSQDGGKDELALSLATASDVSAFEAGQKLVAHVSLKDGRTLAIDTVIGPPRPRVILVSKSVLPGPDPSAIRLGDQDDVPQDGQISFFLKTHVPAVFPRDEKIEVATEDGSAGAMFDVAGGSLFLEDPQTVSVTLRPLKSFGPSVFGSLRYRAISATGERGDWQPLVKLVRIPTLKEVRCPDSPDKPCTLFGQNLFLLDSVASDP